MGLGVARGEHGAAVLIREDGGLEGADLSRQSDDLLLVHADKRLENGHVYDRLRGRHRLHGLTCDLTEIFAGHDGLRARVIRNAFGNAHHESAHDEREILLWALVAYLLLNMGKGDDVERHAPAILRELSAKLYDLVLCLLGGIGEGEEVHRHKAHAALCDHIA